MPGFKSKEDAAFALYSYAPPAQSVRSRPAGQVVSLTDKRAIDLSECGCCTNNRCECEGANRVSARLDIRQSYEIQPSLIPEPGVLVSLMPLPDGDFLVDMNTWGAGSGIGYLQRRDDGRYDVRVGHKSIGTALKPETGMWACFKAYTVTEDYDRFVQGFEPDQDEETAIGWDNVLVDGDDHHDARDLAGGTRDFNEYYAPENTHGHSTV
ncbi:hypothetical protein ACIQPR_48635 [Streptomyces sp. NPDC091280]|uniref:hypothetical protein n=1 Tax=Streptomyces sp. NPDC091280 TaxID=3365984 RepID=UPI00380EF0C8